MPRFLQKIVAGAIQVTGGSPAAGRLLTSDASGNGTWAAPNATQSLNTQSGTSYVLALADADADKRVVFTSNSATTVTIPTNNTIAFPVGALVSCIYTGSATLTVAGASGVTVTGQLIFDGGSFGGGIFGPYAMSTSTAFELIKTGTNTWAIFAPYQTIRLG